MHSWPLVAKIGLVGVAGMIGLGGLGWWQLGQLGSARLTEREHQISTVTDTARGIVDQYVGLESDGVLTTDEAQSRAAEAIAAMRYDDGNYVFVFTEEPRYVVLPTKPELVGESLADLPEVSALLTQLTSAATRAGDSLAVYDYDWPKPGEDQPSPKKSTVAQVEAWGWTVGTGMYIDDIAAAQARARTQLLLALLVVASGMGAVTVAIARSVSRRVGRLAAAADRLAAGETGVDLPHSVGGDEIDALTRSMQQTVGYLSDASAVAGTIASGDLAVDHEPRSEHDVLGQALVSMIHTLREVVGSAVHIAAQLSDGSTSLALASEESARAAVEVATSIGGVADGAGTQASIAESFGASIEQIAGEIRATVGTVEQVVAASDAAAASTGHGVTRMHEAESTMASIREVFDRISSSTGGLDAHSKRVEEIIELIRSIAEQTNLLALNAAIEAARAGEAGRGFAVVATEVKALAEESATSTEQITQIVAEMRNSVTDTVAATSDGAEQVSLGSDVMSEASRSFTTIADAVAAIEDRVGGVSAGAGRIDEATQSIAEGAEQLREITESNSAATEEVAASSEEAAATSEEIGATAQDLSALAKQLEQTVARFNA